jgi:hypothetical protein
VTARTMPRWPLYLIASPAAVAVWSGWVGLGTLCGFGVIHPLPGIWDALRLNTAITLPVGVEAYGAYALGAWLTAGTPERARDFARRSAIGALVLGMLGQVVYHLLAASHAVRAPWPVVVLVSCLPVVTLGFGAALTHLLREPAPEPGAVLASAPGPVSARAPGGALVKPAKPAPKGAAKPAPRKAKGITPEAHFRTLLETGQLPSVRRIRRELHLGQPKAQEVRASLAASVNGHSPK